MSRACLMSCDYPPQYGVLKTYSAQFWPYEASRPLSFRHSAFRFPMGITCHCMYSVLAWPWLALPCQALHKSIPLGLSEKGGGGGLAGLPRWLSSGCTEDIHREKATPPQPSLIPSQCWESPDALHQREVTNPFVLLTQAISIDPSNVLVRQ